MSAYGNTLNSGVMSHRQGDPIRECFERGELDLVYYQNQSNTTEADADSETNMTTVPDGISEELQVVYKQSSTFHKTLREMRDMMEFTDVTVVCEQQTFKAHKLILCAHLPYFRAMFSCRLDEAKSGNVTLKGVDSESFEVILDVMYFRPFPKIRDTKRLKSLLKTSHMLGFSSLFNYCCDQYMKKLNHDYFFDIWNTAELYEVKKMLRLIPVELVKRYDTVKEASDFLSLTIDQLCILVQHLKKDYYNADVILKSILDWIKHDLESRSEKFPQLFTIIDLNCISTKYLSTLLRSEIILKNSVEVTTQVMAEAANRLSRLNPRSEGMQAKFVVLGSLLNTATNQTEYQFQYYDRQRNHWCAAKLPALSAVKTFTPVIVKDILYYVTTNDITTNDDLRYTTTFGVQQYNQSFSFELPMSASRPIVSLSLQANSSPRHMATSSIVRLSLQANSSPKTCCTLTECRTSAGVAALNGEIYIVGGTSGEGIKLRSVERYNATQNKCVQISPMITPHCTQAVASTRTHLYLADVENSRIIIEQYDPKIDKWQLVEFDSPQAITNGMVNSIATAAGKLFFLLNNKLFMYIPATNNCVNVISNLSFVAIGGMSNPKSGFPYLMIRDKDGLFFQFRPIDNSFTKLPAISDISRMDYCAVVAF